MTDRYSSTRRLLPLLLPLFLASACGREEPAPEAPAPTETAARPAPGPEASRREAEAPAQPEREPPAPPPPAGGWQISTGREGPTLSLAGPDGRRLASLSCPQGSDDLIVNVPAFDAIGSEERMSFGAGGTAVALVADTRGDRVRGGVTATGPVPPELAAILADPAGLSVAYGARTSGPHVPVPAALARRFVEGCAG